MDAARQSWRTAMQEEIWDTPRAVSATLETLTPMIARTAALAGGRRHAAFVGRGTSANAGSYGGYLLRHHTSLTAVEVSPDDIGCWDRPIDLSHMVVVGLSQSGRTVEVARSLALARRHGAVTIAITNDGESPVAQAADTALTIAAGTETAVPATKTFTCQLVAAAILAQALGQGDGAEAMHAVPDELQRLCESLENSSERFAERLVGRRALMIAADGANRCIANEFALKLQEACYLPAVGMSFGDAVHGPIAMLNNDFPVVCIGADYPDDGSNAAGDFLRRLNDSPAVDVLGIGSASLVDQRPPGSMLNIAAPRLPAWLSPLGNVLVSQLITEALAYASGISADRPRRLNKVTIANG
ncbi:MAG: hypothetical protein QOJ80_6325 [Mycobacterium sp.]|nr:hypothetical protein [Mycobacterium sp.]